MLTSSTSVLANTRWPGLHTSIGYRRRTILARCFSRMAPPTRFAGFTPHQPGQGQLQLPPCRTAFTPVGRSPDLTDIFDLATVTERFLMSP